MNLRAGSIALLAAVISVVVITRLPGVTARMAAGVSPVSPDSTHTSALGSTPVLVELFTSEGCSSCPPADALLMRLGRTQPIRDANVIVLEEHVDYWDSLGWKDPFSSEAATTRQQEYGQVFGGEQVYTPQMVVDGHAEFVGSDDGKALRAVRAAVATAKPAVNLSWAHGSTLAIRVEPLTNGVPGDTAQVIVAIAENMLRSDVKRGENAGRALEHNGVVRSLTTAGKIETGSNGFSSTVTMQAAHDWNPANLRAVVFVQEHRSRRILAAATIPFPTDVR